MSDALRIAVNELVALAIQERDKLSQAVHADYNDTELRRRIADWHNCKGEYREGGHFPYTGTAKLRDTLIPRYGVSEFDQVFQRANGVALASPVAVHVLPKLELLYKAHQSLIESAWKAADESQRMLPPIDDHADAINSLLLMFNLLGPADETDRNSPMSLEDEKIFYQVGQLVKSRPDDFRSAGQWLDSYFSNSSKGNTAHERFRTAWVDVLTPDGLHDRTSANLMQMQRDEQLTFIGRLLLLTWVVTDPNAADIMPKLTEYQTGGWTQNPSDPWPPDIYIEGKWERKPDVPPNRWGLRIDTLHSTRSSWMPLVQDAVQQWRRRVEAALSDAASQKSKVCGKRGRPTLSEIETNRRLDVLTRWDRAKGAGVSRQKFCDDEGITVSNLDGYVVWQTKRRERGQSGRVIRRAI